MEMKSNWQIFPVEIELVCEGEDEEAALETLVAAIESGLGE